MNACARTRVAWSLACLAVFVFLGGCGGSDSQGFTPPNYDAGEVIGTSPDPSAGTWSRSPRASARSSISGT